MKNTVKCVLIATFLLNHHRSTTTVVFIPARFPLIYIHVQLSILDYCYTLEVLTAIFNIYLYSNINLKP